MHVDREQELETREHKGNERKATRVKKISTEELCRGSYFGHTNNSFSLTQFLLENFVVTSINQDFKKAFATTRGVN